jgi:hypothetical protein
MAIEYDFDMATTSSVAHAADVLCECGGALGLFDTAVARESILDQGVTTGLGLWIKVIEANPRPWNAVKADLGFTPTVWVAFRLDKLGDMSAQEDDMARLVYGLLERIPGDAVLHFQYEEIWLLRRDGDLSLNEQDVLWPPQRLAAVRQPYRRATYAFEQ